MEGMDSGMINYMQGIMYSVSTSNMGFCEG